jgi:plastocyanin
MTRRELVVAGGLALAGRLLPLSLRAEEVFGPTAEIMMRAASGGARVWFDPAGLLVRPGTTIRWVTVVGVHTATAYHPANGELPRRIPEGARPWDSGYLVPPEGTFEVKLEVEGVYDYFCRPHEAAGMAGRIVVSDGGRPPEQSTESIRGHPLPRAVLETLPSVEDIVREGWRDRP